MAKRQLDRQKRGQNNRSNEQKTTLHVQHTFFVHFFPVVLHDYNVKLPNYTFYGGNVVCVPRL